ncbi:hypothetical protein J610_3923 [Acinetobacter sp. 723929]|nr:hypothetical protein ACINWC136_1512 [Acinetobacter pittii]EXA88013.1 hypothetical protein J508_2579 [Acinetobacter sp. 1289694]EXB72437.1 hypothetical protein J551_3619 [Acinetobacter sp. 1475718]EXG33284.1 hypothetical protein J733_0466 [Acinetobacter sp. 263903-2]EXI12700.1 hypothetical protein J610_3923 [Acinetobacter sp. 723929]EXR99883.1 hypothetical protein J687_2283 [Acinetobacter sp. 225588]KCX92099.1 hypothetical protein J584_4267 [Acinetobacter sp. 72431]KCY44145.1 hypothetical 
MIRNNITTVEFIVELIWLHQKRGDGHGKNIGIKIQHYG